ncbi:MAG: DUF222 domain-containing protein [Actinomadura sp.]
MPVVEESVDLAGMLPGPALAGELAGLPLSGLDEYALVEVMRAARRLSAWAESLEFAAIGELDRRRQLQADRCGSWTVEMCRAECDEISAALTLSGTAAAIRLGIAIALDQTLPATRQALAEGRVDGAKARVICDGVVGVRDEIARRVEQLVLPDAPRLTARQLAARVRKAIIDADPEAFQERRKAAEKGRRVELYDNPDGTMDLAARDLPAEDADAAYNYVNALAAAIKSDGDERPIDAIRADVTLDLLRGRRPADVSHAPAPATPQATPHAAPPPGDVAAPGETGPAGGDAGSHEVVVTSRVVREQVTELLSQVRELNGPDEHRLLVAGAARRITDALAPLKVRRCLITADTTGEVVHGHDGYRPPAAMRRLVQTRNDTCAFPTCRRHATTCDLDHTVPYQHGGPTCPCNLAPLCRGHHRLKQHPDWTLIQPWPGVLLWITPTGHWHLTGPAP